MFARYPVPLAFAAALLLVPAVASARRVHETLTEFHFSGSVCSGRVIEVRGLIGDVIAQPSATGQVEVLAVKKPGTGDPAKVRVEVVDHEGGTTVRAVYPEQAAGAAVHFRVRVPRGVRFVGHTANGNVAATGLHGPVEARTVNGDIEIHTTGEARAETVNGSITARLGSLHSAVSLKTVNGNVTVRVPPGAGLDLEAHTTNGAFTAALPFFRAQDSGDHVSGVLGRGGSRLDLRTVNGNISLHPLSR